MRKIQFKVTGEMDGVVSGNVVTWKVVYVSSDRRVVGEDEE